MKIHEITLIRIEYNKWSGFIFNLFNIEINDFEGCLFGFDVGNNYLNIHLLFLFFDVKKPF